MQWLLVEAIDSFSDKMLIIHQKKTISERYPWQDFDILNLSEPIINQRFLTLATFRTPQGSWNPRCQRFTPLARIR